MLGCEGRAPHGDSLGVLHIRATAKVERNFEPTHGKTLFRENTKCLQTRENLRFSLACAVLSSKDGNLRCPLPTAITSSNPKL